MNIYKPVISRLEAVKLLGVAGIGTITPLLSLFSNKNSMRQRTIPSSGEKLPIVGLGTWIQFDVNSSKSERDPLRKVLRMMVERGGKLIDSSPMYGRSEKVVGDLTTELGLADHFFYATKVWTQGKQSGINQMNESLEKMNRKTMDLFQVHNLLDWQTHLKTLHQWKAQGKTRYIGVTHHTDAAHEQLENIIRMEDIDFAQFNYSIRDRHAEKGLLAAARENKVAVIINEPFGGGTLFKAVSGRILPTWAREYDIHSWAQFFLKYILAHPAVTCVIPGTSNPQHLVDNMGAGYGRLPDQEGRQRMVKFIENT